MQKKQGVIISTKMDKTVVVEIDDYKMDSIYKKKYKDTKKFKAHVEDTSKFKEWQKVAIVECRPYSKTKTWKVIENA